ncbi:uncharacterized protein LOC134464219 [Engraulis encrasicolus]|uniref:uncharacterized protein LOC134464219 n=1 Tax=Engraulis encrasicolus TaxID=184585 RepID=UPI002FD1F599
MEAAVSMAISSFNEGASAILNVMANLWLESTTITLNTIREADMLRRIHPGQLPRYLALTAPQKRKAKTADAASSRPTKQLKIGETIAIRKSVDQAVMNFVIQSLQPFSVVDQPSFQQLLKDLQPNAPLMSRTTLRRRIDDAALKMKRTMKEAMLSSVELSFLEEYARTMGPVGKALNILQGENDVQMGWLLPTLTLLITKLDKIRITSRYCKPLVDAVQEGLQHRFADMLVEPEFIAAAILVPKFKTTWTSDDELILRGMDYIKAHLEEETANLSPANGSSDTDDEDFFASFKKSGQGEVVKQLEGYLASKLEHKGVLMSYPAVCKLSMKLNTALPASAACERLFSTAGLIFSPRRARIDAKNFENQLLLKRNVKYLS